MGIIADNPRISAWYRASRPRTLTATYAPLGLAAVIALDEGVFSLWRFVLAFVGALFLQIASNLINEYADYRRGADTLKEAGQGMIIKEEVLKPGEVLLGAIATTLAGVIIGLLLLAYSGPLLLWIGVGGVLVVILYTAGPFPLAYYGLGEVTVFVFMGPLMVLGAYYVMASGQTSATPLLAGIPIGFMVAAIMLANNIRDEAADRAASKRTLVVLFGSGFGRGLYVFLVLGAYVAVAAMVLAGVMPWPMLIAAVTLPEASRLVRMFTRRDTDTTQLHQGQGRTARLHGQFGLWLVIGWLVALGLERLVG